MGQHAQDEIMRRYGVDIGDDRPPRPRKFVTADKQDVKGRDNSAVKKEVQMQINFIKLHSTTREGEARVHILRVNDIIAVGTDTREGGAIVNMRNSDYAVWAEESTDEVYKLLVEAGANIKQVE